MTLIIAHEKKMYVIF